MTLHAVKGLEFPLVFLVGMEEGFLPHGGMQGQLPDLEEERRLCYVGITRARERLVLTNAGARERRATVLPRTPSRFLGALPMARVRRVDLTAPAKASSERKSKFWELVATEGTVSNEMKEVSHSVGLKT
jgi:superfamily I DNA/RNA helicase